MSLPITNTYKEMSNLLIEISIVIMMNYGKSDIFPSLDMLLNLNKVCNSPCPCTFGILITYSKSVLSLNKIYQGKS